MHPARTILVMAATAVLLLSACNSSGEPQQSPTPAATTQAEIFLAPATDPMPDPFTSDTSNDVGSANETPSATPTSTSTTEVTSRTGTDERLYAASEQPACDVEQLISDLDSNTEARQTWADIRGISESEIPEYLRGLAPVVLRLDTRVTNHRYTDGSGVAFQAVLQAGTAVLVDNTGMPVVRCACGNPLLAPQAASTGASYVGTSWPGFSPNLVIVVTPGTQVNVIVCIKINTTVTINVPVSSGPSGGTSEPAPATSTPEASATAPTGAPPTGDYTSCARRYGELVKELTLAGGITPKESENWSKQAKKAAELARKGDLAGAYRECWIAVGQMETALATR